MPAVPTDDEWTDLVARVAVSGSAEVQRKLADYHEWEEEFYLFAGELESRERRKEPLEEIADMRKSVEGSRRGAFEAIDGAEQAMRDELATL